MAPRPASLPFVLTSAWACMSSAAVVIVLAAPVPPLTIAASRVAITAAVWFAIASLTGARRSPVVGGDVPRARIAASGALLGLHFALWIGSLTLTTVTHAATLVATQPLFAGLFGLFLGDRASWRLAIGVAVALGGTALMSGGEAGDASLTGDAFALAAAACSAGYLTVNRGVRDALPLPNLLWRVNAWACLAILAMTPLFGGAMWHADAGRSELLAIAWLGVIPGLVGHGLMNWAARSLPVHIVSVTILLEPVGAALAAWWILDQAIGGRDALGASLLLVGAAVAMAPRRK